MLRQPRAQGAQAQTGHQRAQRRRACGVSPRAGEAGSVGARPVGGRKGDLSRFIEEAVRAYLLERAVDQAKTAAAGMDATELSALIDEAVQWARAS